GCTGGHSRQCSHERPVELRGGGDRGDTPLTPEHGSGRGAAGCCPPSAPEGLPRSSRRLSGRYRKQGLHVALDVNLTAPSRLRIVEPVTPPAAGACATRRSQTRRRRAPGTRAASRDRPWPSRGSPRSGLTQVSTRAGQDHTKTQNEKKAEKILKRR